MYRRTLAFPYQLEGLPFVLEDLTYAMEWAKNRADVQLKIKLDCFCIIEIIEVYPAGWSVPRWCVWQTIKGGLQVDDLYTDEFALPYPTVAMALRFMASRL